MATIYEATMANLHIGLSGFSYKEWVGEGLFYPPGAKSAGFFGYYCSRMTALEGVGMAYKMPAPAAMEKWAVESPPDFAVSPKMHQEVTHFKRLKPASYEAVKLFMDAMDPLEKAGKLGPILLQLPPNFKRDDELLSTFLSCVPHRPGVRWSMEFRNESWNCVEVEDILRKFGVGWVVVEDEDSEAVTRDTAGHVYIRLRKLTYTDEQLQSWAKFIGEMRSAGKDCFVYCRHKDTHAPWLWADRLRQLLS